MVERHLAKVIVVSSNLISRSKLKVYGTVTRKAREWIANPFYAGSIPVCSSILLVNKRISYSGNTLAFQAKAVSSILTIRSKFRKGIFMDKYYIVYPKGDKTRLSIISLSPSSEHELYDYKVASRQEFYDMEECIEYAKNLARKHNLQLDSSEREISKELDYLD